MKKRDKIITAACRTTEGLEWTTLKVTQEGNEPSQQGNLPAVLPDDISEDALATLPLPEGLEKHLVGEVTVALRTSELLMRTMEFPTSDPSEIAEMVGFQIDKVSPYPLDQLAVAHEILNRSDETALVLMVAAKREIIDTIGDTFEKKGIQIHGIDARVLGWLQLMREQDQLSSTGSEVLIIVDGIDFVLVVMLDGNPVAFRSLHVQLADMTVVDELTYEIGYTLTTLDAEHDLPVPSTINFWNTGTVPMPLRSTLAEKCGLKVQYHDLSELPTLSEGIVQRTHSKESRIELIPREWIEYKKRKILIRKFSIIASSIAVVWLCVLIALFSIYKMRDIKLNQAKAEAKAIAPAAQIAQENQDKLKALTAYTDRTDSALECLREITQMLPAGDIEFTSYKYTKRKGKSVVLRGSARNDDIITDFFKTLTSSSLFERLTKPSVEAKSPKRGVVQRAEFSVTLILPTAEEIK